MKKDLSVKPPTEATLTKWSERPVRIVALAVVSGLIVWFVGWLISRHYDKPTPSSVTVIDQPRSQPQPEAPTSAPATTSPRVPAQKHQSPPNPAKPQHGNAVHIGDHTGVSQSSTGDCSPNIIGGSPTVNCGPLPPPPLQYTWSIQDVKSESPAYKFAKAISV